MKSKLSDKSILLAGHHEAVTSSLQHFLVYRFCCLGLIFSHLFKKCSLHHVADTFLEQHLPACFPQSSSAVALHAMTGSSTSLHQLALVANSSLQHLGHIRVCFFSSSMALHFSSYWSASSSHQSAVISSLQHFFSDLAHLFSSIELHCSSCLAAT